MEKRIWKFVAGSRPGITILFTLVLLAISCYFTLQLRFSYDYEDFFPKGDDDLDFYYEFRSKFEHDDNFLLIGFKNENGFLNQDFLSRLDSATNQLQKLEESKRVYSISNFRYFVKSPFGFFDYPALHIDDSSRYTADSARISQDERITGKLISEDFKTCVIFIKTIDTLKQQNSTAFVNDIKNILDKNHLPDYHLLGKAYFQSELVTIQRNEFLLYSFLSILLVAIITFIMFRSIWCVVICLFTVATALLLFTGILGALGFDQNVMSTLYPIVIIIIGISDAVHFLSKYISELSREEEINPDENKKTARKSALQNTLNDIGAATFLTAVTSAIGFLTMLTSNVPPLKLFGVFSGLGVLVAFLVVLFVTSPILKYFSLEQLAPSKKSKRKDFINWPKFLHGIYLFGKNRPKRILIVMSVLMLIFGYGITEISTDIHIGAGLPKHAQITTDFEFFEENFNGFRPFEVAAIAQDNYSISDPEVLHLIDSVETYIKQFEIIKGVQSITMVYKSLNRAYHGDQISFYKLPEEESQFKSFENDLSKFKLNEIDVLMSKDKKYGRISGFLSDAGTDSIQDVQADIRNYISKHTDPAIVDFKVTGTGIIFDKNTEYLRRNIISGVLLAFLCIGLLMAFMFRNWKMVIISIVPNILPLFVCAGIMGLLNIELDAPTSIIFGISYGIAVDDTIHFLSKFRIEMNKGFSLEDSIRNTFEETGKAVFVMSVILLFGFAILMVSSTAATFNIGLLTGVTLFSAVWPDMLLLPMMLRKWMKRK